MFGDPQQLIRLVIAGGTFGLVLAAWLVIVIIYYYRRSSRERAMHDRLAMVDPPDEPVRVLNLWHEGQKASLAVPDPRRRDGLIQRLQRTCRDAGIEAPLQSVLLGVVGAAGLAFVVGYLMTGRLLAGICAAAAVILLLVAYVKRRISQRARVFEAQLLDGLELIARSLRAGHPLLAAFRLIGDEIPSPVGPMFSEVCQQQQLGVPLEEAVRQVSDRSRSPDMRVFATSVEIQLRSGGNLADMMERLSHVIRERVRLSRRVRVLTASVQLNKWILVALPFLFFVLVSLMNPEYMEPLHSTTLGQVLLLVAGGMLTLGVWVMNIMTKPKF